jgi:alkylhydroperoxidase/carboxymuconolactone decarboxylase family protein YurZ
LIARMRAAPSACASAFMSARFSQRNTGRIPLSEKLPDIIEVLRAEHPDVWERYQALEAALAAAGPIDARTQRLLKLALALGARHEGAVRSHARRALREGVTREELLQVALLGVTTLGWPQATAGRAWILSMLDAAGGSAGNPRP